MTRYVAYVRDQQVINLQRANGVLPADRSTVDGFTVVHVDSDLGGDRIAWMKTHYWDDNTWQTRSEAPNYYASWDASSSSWSWDNETVMTEIRTQRNNKLKRSDWTQMADSPLTDAKKTEWATYRQSLRNFPSTLTNPESVESVTWPTEPT